MFFFFGWGERVKDLGEGASRTCPRCGNHSVWRRVRRSKQVTVFFIPVARWGRRDQETCTICQETVELTAG